MWLGNLYISHFWQSHSLTLSSPQTTGQFQKQPKHGVTYSYRKHVSHIKTYSYRKHVSHIKTYSYRKHVSHIKTYSYRKHVSHIKTYSYRKHVSHIKTYSYRKHVSHIRNELGYHHSNSTFLELRRRHTHTNTHIQPVGRHILHCYLPFNSPVYTHTHTHTHIYIYISVGLVTFLYSCPNDEHTYAQICSNNTCFHLHNSCFMHAHTHTYQLPICHLPLIVIYSHIQITQHPHH